MNSDKELELQDKQSRHGDTAPETLGKEYATPELRDYGTVQELTQTSGEGSTNDTVVGGPPVYASGAR